MELGGAKMRVAAACGRVRASLLSEV